MICPLCKKEHEELNKQIENHEFQLVVAFKVCPQVPPNHIYVDHEFPTGPRGVLLNLESDA